ncbi:MAG: phenylalanine--tRNA ligase subunit beta, partial [Planctomycetales bacterium]|nr:phenylalanine--tRNA ligase subunit beta [Planctomycetales bacterium]
MKVLWSWLSELCELPDGIGPREAAVALTQVGLEIESIETTGAQFDGVIVAQVVSFRGHPNANKLRIVTVDDGAGTHDVVCGAPNVPEQGYVLWAKPGSTLPGGMTLGIKDLKGVMSPGMLCGETELEIGDDDSGIVVLAEGVPGQDAKVALGLGDTLLDIAAPANRPDCLGHLGIARELVAQVGGKIVLPILANSWSTRCKPPTITISDHTRCPRYTARRVVDVTVGPSPWKVRSRLRAVGVRPINNLVDVTNYVMFELGQPLHAFDGRAVENISVRVAKPGEKITTLDDTERTLAAADLVICVDDSPEAIAGVMGGANTEVTNATTSVVIESAAFESLAVRRTARRLGLHSESSHRFERHVDPHGAALASDRAATLMMSWAGGEAGPLADVYPTPPSPVRVALRHQRLEQISGMTFAPALVQSLLHKLAIETSTTTEGVYDCTPPSYRNDLAREIDFIEEVVRMYGFHKLPSTLPASAPPMDSGSLQQSRTQRVKRELARLGWLEAITFGFFDPARLRWLNLPASDPRRAPIAVQNPMSKGQAAMRSSLIPNLLAAVSHNQRHGETCIPLYEVGSVFAAGSGDNPEKLTALAQEQIWACGVLAGEFPRWLDVPRAADFADIRAALETALHGYKPIIERDAVSYLHPGASARVVVDGAAIGYIGELHPDVAAAADIAGRAFLFDIRIDHLAEPALVQMRPIPKFPAT